ncbi:MAG: LicD family protein [Clostridia bacterium]|nr:LicD family protein [Clostridia bacterium]
MEELRKKQLELLRYFIDVCEQLNLKWYCVCGTALGAVKYGGYIPWDDDIDVALPRPDYEKFLASASAILPKHIFVQSFRTDPAYTHEFSKLRNSNTTQIELSVKHLNMNHGIYIDVFPLDGHPQKKHEQKLFDLQNKLFTWKQFCYIKKAPQKKLRARNFVFRLLGYHKRTAQTLSKKEKLYAKYPIEQSEYWCNYGNWQGKLEYAHRSQYGNGTKATFEGISVIVPENYDAYLTQKYGNWRKDPPAEKQKSHHVITVYDAERSYVEYLNQTSSATAK